MLWKWSVHRKRYYHIISALPGDGHKKKTLSSFWQISFQRTEIFIVAHERSNQPGSADHTTETQQWQSVSEREDSSTCACAGPGGSGRDAGQWNSSHSSIATGLEGDDGGGFWENGDGSSWSLNADQHGCVCSQEGKKPQECTPGSRGLRCTRCGADSPLQAPALVHHQPTFQFRCSPLPFLAGAAILEHWLHRRVEPRSRRNGRNRNNYKFNQPDYGTSSLHSCKIFARKVWDTEKCHKCL